MPDWTGPTWDTVPSIVPSTPSTWTPAESPTLTDGTWELSSVPATSNDCVPMMTITLVLESALTVSPTVIPTETTVPLMGLVRFASARDCSSTVSSASAVSMAAWSAAICWGVSAEAEEPVPPPVPPEPVPVPFPVPLPELPVELAGVDERALGVWVGEPAVLDDPWLSASDSAASSLATAASSADTSCWSLKTWARAASQLAGFVVVVVDVVVVVVPVPQASCAWARSAASFC